MGDLGGAPLKPFLFSLFQRESQKPCRSPASPPGLAVVGGLVFSQLIILYLTPVIYIYLEGAREKVKRWRQKT